MWSFWATVEQVRPTFFSAVPTIYALLVSRPGARPDTRSLRFVICGAAPMPRQLIGEFEERFGVPVVEGYGLSECTVACTLNPLHGVRKAGSVGLPMVPEDLIEHCRRSLARYKVPREVYIEEMLPKNAVGKIAKPELRQRLRDARPPQSADT